MTARSSPCHLYNLFPRVSPLSFHSRQRKEYRPLEGGCQLHCTVYRSCNNFLKKIFFLKLQLPIIGFLCLGHYTVNDKLIFDSPKTATAPFKSTTERKMMLSPDPCPGPGSYEPSVDLDQMKSKKQSGFQ